MFEDLIRELKRLQGTHQVSVSIPSDSEGYIDRVCPSSECQFEFKIHEADWKDKVRNEEVFCPFCGHTADADQWWTENQIAHAKEAAFSQVQNRLGQALKRDATRWNRHQPRNSFIRITMKVDNLPRHIFLPPPVAALMRLKITCSSCACRYAVIGAAFFCPACGHNAAEHVFSQSIQGIRSALDALPAVRSAIEDRDTAENTVRLIVENGLQNAVTAFQRYAEVLFAHHPNPPKARRNVFQNLSEGSTIWQMAFGKSYMDHLNPIEFAALVRYFQQRHLLAHKEGLVDADYLTKGGDASYQPGQRLVVRKASVQECLDIIEKLSTGLALDAGGTP